MSDHTPFQKKVIGRYYDNLADIKLRGLSELVSELFLAESDSQLNRLWKRVAKAMVALKIPPESADRIIERRDPEFLARNLKQWLSGEVESRNGPGGPRT
ncbi:MAG: hypothetical protein KJ749_03535 [Planctomycetes bacterium]|nr:hypothetical protein [Planctomycetota bacterium]